MFDALMWGPEVLSAAHLERARGLAARLEQELAQAETRIGLLEVQRRAMLGLLDRWEERMARITHGRLRRTGLEGIEECRREVSRVIECGPPIRSEPSVPTADGVRVLVADRELVSHAAQLLRHYPLSLRTENIVVDVLTVLTSVLAGREAIDSDDGLLEARRTKWICE